MGLDNAESASSVAKGGDGGNVHLHNHGKSCDTEKAHRPASPDFLRLTLLAGGIICCLGLTVAIILALAIVAKVLVM